MLYSQVNSDEPAVAADVPAPAAAGGSPFLINYYRQYFDIDTSQFLTRAVSLALPVGKVAALRADEPHVELPELYGAVWCTATIIVLLFLCSTGLQILAQWMRPGSGAYAYDFGLLTKSFTLLYGYVVVVPVAVYAATRWWFKVQPYPLVLLVSVYGYATTAWVPAAVLQLANGILANHNKTTTVVKWVCVAVGGVLSGVGIGASVWGWYRWSGAQAERSAVAPTVTAAVAVLHGGFTLAVAIAFFGLV